MVHARVTKQTGEGALRMAALALLAACAMACALLAFPRAAYANHLAGGDGWTVAYTPAGAMQDTFSAKQWADDISGLQPGDDITFTVGVQHRNAAAADWYMSNAVLKTLEEGVAQGSDYGYLLTYTGPDGATRTLYDSSIVGGDRSGGLLDATGPTGLEDFFFLDNLSNGQDGTVKLVVGLDGETEQNAYFDTIAQLKMRFAVEPAESKPGTPNRVVVRTGDDTDALPLFVAMGASGAVLLALGFASLRSRRRQGKGARDDR